jgi:ABC-type Zn uptake system ZnuABC Zn-binding protein ZnuA
MQPTPLKGEDYRRMILANMNPNVWYNRRAVIQMIENLGVLRSIDKTPAGKQSECKYERRISNALKEMKNVNELVTQIDPSKKKNLLYMLSEK